MWFEHLKPISVFHSLRSVIGSGMCLRQASPIKMNLRVFAGNAGTWPFPFIRNNKEAGTPEAAGTYTGNTSITIELMLQKVKRKGTK